jgi:hypothetical protein
MQPIAQHDACYDIPFRQSKVGLHGLHILAYFFFNHLTINALYKFRQKSVNHNFTTRKFNPDQLSLLLS